MKITAERLLTISIVATGVHLLVGTIYMLYVLLFSDALAGIAIIIFYFVPTLFWLFILFLLKRRKNKDSILFMVICVAFCIVSVLFSIAYIISIFWF